MEGADLRLMSDWPKDTLDFAPYGTLSTGDENCPLADMLAATSVVFSNAGSWPLANLAFYIPVLVRAPVTVYQLAWGNGSTLGSNVDVGIYDGSSKARLVSTGSTPQSGASQVQAVDVADTPIPVGLHYLAMAVDGAGPGLVYRGNVASTPALRASGVAQQASAFPLPSTAAFATVQQGTMPLIIAAIAGSVF